MFDIGFFELLVIAVLALLVLGPERLPHAARTAGLWIGRIRRTVSNIQQEISAQLHAEEMRQQLKENQQKLQDTLNKANQSLHTDEPASRTPSVRETTASEAPPAAAEPASVSDSTRVENSAQSPMQDRQS